MFREPNYVIQMHGMETNHDYVIPDGVTIIMFRYSGKTLYIPNKVDQFNWESVFLDDKCKDYNILLKQIYTHPLYRKHFAVYHSGNTIKDIELKPEKISFHDGIFRLPIKVALFDHDSKVIYISSDVIFEEVIKEFGKMFRIMVSPEMVARYVVMKYPILVYSSIRRPMKGCKLSKIIREIQMIEGSVNLLLLTCREGIPKHMEWSRTLKEELNWISDVQK